MSFAFVFPGQNSQSVGMLAGLAADSPVIGETFAEASAALGYDLWQLVQQGPEERLNATEQTQPAMLAAGIATYRLWRRQGGPEPSVVAGHSLGEFTALVCAETLAFRDATELVRFRGRFMQEAVPVGTGAMAAILGLTDAVQRAMEAAKARGAKRAILLAVSVPAHSSLMREAAHRLEERVAAIQIKMPRIRYISAVDASPHEDPADIRKLIVRQLSSPVRWTDTVRALSALGVAQIIECGPGTVLTGLNRRIEKRPDLAFAAISDPESLRAVLAAVAGS